jgi:hypothetical protein
MNVQRESDCVWHIERGPGPLVATAIHDGHEVREEVHRHMFIDGASRLRKMNEWTGEVDEERFEAVGRALESTVPGVLEKLEKL